MYSRYLPKQPPSYKPPIPSTESPGAAAAQEASFEEAIGRLGHIVEQLERGDLPLESSLALFEEGQEVVLPSPCWSSFPEQIRFAGARPVMVPTSVEDGFRIHAGPILDAVTDRTRALLAGYQIHIAKPIEPRELIAALSTLSRRPGRAKGVLT